MHIHREGCRVCTLRSLSLSLSPSLHVQRKERETESALARTCVCLCVWIRRNVIYRRACREQQQHSMVPPSPGRPYPRLETPERILRGGTPRSPAAPFLGRQPQEGRSPWATSPANPSCRRRTWAGPDASGLVHALAPAASSRRHRQLGRLKTGHRGSAVPSVSPAAASGSGHPVCLRAERDYFHFRPCLQLVPRRP